MDTSQLIAQELSLDKPAVTRVLSLFTDGNTVPFIARYRKEATGGLDEVVLRRIQERHTYLTELAERKAAVIKSITDQGKLTDQLEKRIDACFSKTELEELYLPFKPKKRTRATIAKEKGLEPLAYMIMEMKDGFDPAAWATEHQGELKEVTDADEALAGAGDIIAESIAETAEYRALVHAFMVKNGHYVSKAKKEYADQKTKYSMYYDYRHPVATIASHNLLALRRAEAEGIITVTIELEDEKILEYLKQKVLSGRRNESARLVEAACEDAYQRLIKPAVANRIRMETKEEADKTAIGTFAANLKNLLLAPPAGGRPVIGLDPGFKTGCKVVVLDRTGRLLEDTVIYPTEPKNDYPGASRTLFRLIDKYQVELVAIGNGTASRETEQFVRKTLREKGAPAKAGGITVMVVNESGASVYSASETAAAEFPDRDVTVRGAVSIARRLQDPLAELVKIDPKAIGVGQYQHDVDQKLLKQKLDEVVESCVNFVGVDTNTASVELLSYVAGLNQNQAQEIVRFRHEHGLFTSRQDLLKVKKVGPKAFEQSAGFLRIRNAKNPLDNSAVHPESYPVVERISKRLQRPLTDIIGNHKLLDSVYPQDLVDEKAGLPTIRDILEELKKPGRDPRREFITAVYDEAVKEISDLQPGMVLEGNITNVTNFGAFVDIGVHQDGLVHISEIANTYVKNVTDFTAVGQVVKVKVLEVDLGRKRISLSMKQAGSK